MCAGVGKGDDTRKRTRCQSPVVAIGSGKLFWLAEGALQPPEGAEKRQQADSKLEQCLRVVMEHSLMVLLWEHLSDEIAVRHHGSQRPIGAVQEFVRPPSKVDPILNLFD